MIRLLNSIKEDAKKRKITNKVIAHRLKVSEGQVSNYFSDKNRISGVKFVELISVVYEDEYQMINKRIMQYIENTTKKDYIADILEWCQHTGRKSVQRQIMDQCKDIDDPIFLLYELFLKRSERTISANQFIIELEKIKYQSNNQPSFIALGWIGLLYAYYDLHNFNMFFLAEEALKEIDKMNNEYLKVSFKLRIYELQAVGAFKENKIKLAIEAANKIINSENAASYPMPLTAALILLSEIYAFDNYKKSLEYIYQAFQIFNKIKDTSNKRRKIQLEATHDFIKISNRDYQNLFLTDPEEEAHFLASIGGEENVRKSNSILNEIETKTGKLTPFQKYYKALALRDANMMGEVKDIFLKNGDLFYSELPKRALDMMETHKI